VQARKRFGQHFLHDGAVLGGIASAVGLAPGDSVLEIGPGKGALTDYLYRDDLKSYVAVEIDRDLVPLLGTKYPAARICNEDILRTDLAKLMLPEPESGEPPSWRLVGNLPYNISSPLVIRLLDFVNRYPGAIRDMHFMLQREMASRLAATPGTKAWGRLSVVTQLSAHVEVLFDVAPSSFTPPPRVDSSVLRLTPRTSSAALLSDAERKRLDQVLRMAFSGRRKRLSNSLKDLGLDWQSLELDPASRADDLTAEAYLRISAWLTEETEG
tara:strand:+ start:2478 stop:3287 length:810 start_codon:yes stop_codon:yes gene_type:complete